MSAPVRYCGRAGDTQGFDQVNVRVPGQLHGAGTVNVVVTADGQASNAVIVAVK